MGGTIYIERSGSIVVSGVTHSVPAVKGTGVVTIGESLATVYHGVVGDSISFTGTEFTVVPAGGGGPTLTSTTPTPTYSTGVAVAAYTICQLDVGVCEYQWELFTLVPAASTIPGCSTANALYSSVVSVAPDLSNIPELGPFSIDGLTNCYHNHATGGGTVSCVKSVQYSSNCFFSGSNNSNCAGNEEVSCNPDETESYNLDDYVYWWF